MQSPTTIRRGSQQWVGQIPTILRDIFRPSPNNKIAHFSREMTMLSTILIDPSETMETAVNADTKHDVCLVSESPLYIVRVRWRNTVVALVLLDLELKVAGTGNVVEFERLIRDDLSKLKVTNAAGLCAAHNAAARNRAAILALIAQYHGGSSFSTHRLFFSTIVLQIWILRTKMAGHRYITPYAIMHWMPSIFC